MVQNAVPELVKGEIEVMIDRLSATKAAAN